MSGNKSERTIKMEKIVYDYFLKEHGVELQYEVSLPYGKPDYCYIEVENNKPQKTIIVEIKQSTGDMNSGHGQNFYGNYNYMAVPSELIPYAMQYLHNNGKKYVGLLAVDIQRQICIECSAPTYMPIKMDARYKKNYNLVPFSLRIDKNDKKKLENIAWKNHTTVTAIINNLIVDLLSKEGIDNENA